MNLEQVAMNIVGNAGEARSLSFEALSEAKKNNFEKANELLKKAREKELVAHELQTELICREADGKNFEINLLIVHAQDHLMSAMLARELILEIINLYGRLECGQ